MPLPLVYHPDYSTTLPDGHRFPMAKFGALYDVLLRDGVAAPDQFHCPEEAPATWLRLAHDAAYVDAYLTGTLEPAPMRRIGLPWSAALVHRTRVALAGTVLAAELALAHGLAGNLAGGTHHAHGGFGSGFCIFNDVAVAARVLQAGDRVRRVLIVDLDVHQGDGSAAILTGDDSVFTCSMHCAANFPFRKAQSDLDIELPIGMEDDAYLARLAQVLPGVLEHVRPELVFYNAGVDPHGDDLLGKLALTDAGLYRRDLYVLRECLRRGIPTACVIGGGYDRNTARLARRHSLVHRAATEEFARL